MNAITEPKTLQQAVVHFSNPDNCIAYMVARRWPDGVVKCPTCGRDDVKYIAKRRVWQCKTRHKKCQFSVKVGTIMEDSPISLDKWLVAMWMLANCRNGISSHEIKRTLGVTQKSTWFMLHRIRWAMRDASDGPSKLGGTDRPEHPHRSRRIVRGRQTRQYAPQACNEPPCTNAGGSRRQLRSAPL